MGVHRCLPTYSIVRTHFVLNAIVKFTLPAILAMRWKTTPSIKTSTFPEHSFGTFFQWTDWVLSHLAGWNFQDLWYLWLLFLKTSHESTRWHSPCQWIRIDWKIHPFPPFHRIWSKGCNTGGASAKVRESDQHVCSTIFGLQMPKHF